MLIAAFEAQYAAPPGRPDVAAPEERLINEPRAPRATI
jgi:hypothetical protein